MKRQAAIGDIQNQAAIFGTHADIGDIHEFRSWSLAAVSRLHRGFHSFAQTSQFPAGV